MNSRLCAKLGIEFPLFAFSHCRNVVVEVSKAGGFGVLGAVGLTPENLEQELNWIDENIDGKPYGIDLLIPNRMDHKNENSQTTDDLKAFMAHLDKLGVPYSDWGDRAVAGWHQIFFYDPDGNIIEVHQKI